VHLDKFSITQIKAVTFVLSFLLFVLLSWNTIINNDGILYLRALNASIEDGWRAAIPYFNWPFYIWMLTCVAKLFHLSAENAALVFNATACSLFSVGFLHLMQSLELKKSHFWIAAAVILMFPGINAHRDMILRDFGYWACYIFGISYLLRFNKDLRLKHAFAWLACLMTAVLFRIEAFLFLCLAPLSVLWTHRNSKACLRAALALYAFPLLLGVIAAVYLLKASSVDLGRFQSYSVYTDFILHGFGAYVKDRGLLVAKAFALEFPPEFGSTFLIGGVVFYLILISIRAFSLQLTLLWFWGNRTNRWQLPAYARAPIQWIFSLNVMMCGLFALRNGFLAERFLMGFLFLMLIFIPFYLPNLWAYILEHSSSRSAKNSKLAFLALLCALTCVDGLFTFGYSKEYLREAGHWLQTNTPVNSMVYASSFQVDYYAHRSGRNWGDNFTDEQLLNDLSNQNWRKYDYIAVRLRHKRSDFKQKLVELIPVKPIHQVANQRGDSVWIYDVRNLH
jgi:hypothetical protein